MSPEGLAAVDFYQDSFAYYIKKIIWPIEQKTVAWDDGEGLCSLHPRETPPQEKGRQAPVQAVRTLMEGGGVIIYKYYLYKINNNFIVSNKNIRYPF